MALLVIFSFFLYLYIDTRYLHSFPTRRSSDLASAEFYSTIFGWKVRRRGDGELAFDDTGGVSGTWVKESDRTPDERTRTRSEEHTSELQSCGHLVCRLLLEKKKKKTILHNTTH